MDGSPQQPARIADDLAGFPYSAGLAGEVERYLSKVVAFERYCDARDASSRRGSVVDADCSTHAPGRKYRHR